MNTVEMGFSDNGFRGIVGMVLKADTPQHRELLDELMMSLPLGAAFAITGLRWHEGTLMVSVVPELMDAMGEAASEAYARINQILIDLWVGVCAGAPDAMRIRAEEVAMLIEPAKPKRLIEVAR